MTSRFMRDKGELIAIVIACDQMDCDTSVDDTEIKNSGGLKEMGWTVVPVPGGLHHYCPEHRRD